MKGATEDIIPLAEQKIAISIHAPVKGATDDNGGGAMIDYNFNPRTCERCD